MRKKVNTAKKTVTKRNGNREGQFWAEGDRVGMTLRLPPDIELEIRKYTLMKGDLSVVIRFALEHVKKETVEIVKTRKAGLGLGRPMLLHVGADARNGVRDWALKEGVSVNSIIVSVLEHFVDLAKRKPKVDEELRSELRARRGL